MRAVSGGAFLPPVSFETYGLFILQFPSRVHHSKFVGFLREFVGELRREQRRLVLGQPVFGHQPREERTVDAAGDIMTRWYGKERARVVVEADGVVETRGLRGLFAEPHHS